jgi:hypothetical protein
MVLASQIEGLIRMTHRRVLRNLLSSIILLALAGCNMPGMQVLPNFPGFNIYPPPAVTTSGPIATALPPPGQTLITFQVQTPPGTPPDVPIYLTLLDEVTGLALNAQTVPMQALPGLDETSSQAIFIITLPFPIGSVVKYRYERQSGPIRVAEHLSDGSAVRYRLFHVTGQDSVADIVSRWTDTAYDLLTGRIQGKALDAKTGQPIPGLLIAAAGAQTLTTSDGSFMLEGLPPGVHNLVGYSVDGSYQTFQQGARVAEGSTTPAEIEIEPAGFSNVVFVVKPPKGTPPIIPLRFAGSLVQLGNTFASLPGGISSLAVNMPVLNTLPDGRYTITLSLPAGADIRYKYTLGDGFWNAEHTSDGAFKLRQLIVPDNTVLVEDTIETWSAGPPNSITFDLTVPADTPSTDFVSIQLNPGFGWTEPLPMWNFGGNRWAYILYGPLNLPGDFSYRYCRNNQCGVADDSLTPGPAAPGRTMQIAGKPQTQSDRVTAWVNWSDVPNVELPAVENVQGRGDGYWTGFELSTGYRPSWDVQIPLALENIRAGGANHVVLTPTWSYGRGSPENTLPILAPLPGQDPSWSSMIRFAEKADSLGLKTAVRPLVNFPMPVDDWWSSASRDASWWQVWFEQYRTFALHHADLASQAGAQTLILGGEWLRPALPGEKLSDGTPSDLPEDAEIRWRNLLSEIRAHFNGQLAWAIAYRDILLPPSFLDLVDRTYLELPVEPGKTIDQTLGLSLDTWLDGTAISFQYLNGRPLILAVACPSNPDLQSQVDCYQTLLAAANQRDWISGIISLGYYPPVALRGNSASVNGKPASELIGTWYSGMTK